MKKQASLVAHGLVGWAICGATVGIGRQIVSMQVTLLIHAIVAPLAFGLLTWHHAGRFPDPRPGRVALTMVAIVVGLDAFLVAPLLEGSYAMFRSILGTWLPVALIATASYVGARAARPAARASTGAPV